MGNSISYSLNGDGSLSPAYAEAFQTVNPSDLKMMDEYYGKPGQSSLHEITEAYQGVQISFGKGVSSGYANAPGSVCNQAHILAIPQSGVIYENRYDEKDNKLPREKFHNAKWIDYNVGVPPRDKNVKTIKCY